MDQGFPILLTLVSGAPEESLRQWQLHPAEQITIGRSRSSDVRLRGETVSRRHAMLSFSGGRWSCENLSPNGTLIDEELINRAPLHHEAILQCSHEGPRLKVGFPKEITDISAAPGSISLCLGDLPYGDASAERMLWDRYFNRIAALARQRFGNVPRGPNDEEDAAICVFRKLFAGVRDGRYPELSDRNSLWRLLATMTRRQTREFIQRETRLKRGGGDVWRETDQLDGDTTVETRLDDFPSHDPTPQHVAQLSEQLGRHIDKLDDELGEVAFRKLQGYSNEDTAQALGISIRTVERRLNKIRELWSEPSSDFADSKVG